MTKTDANKIIHTQIMGGCDHTYRSLSHADRGDPLLCIKCGTHVSDFAGIPDYTGDANEALKVWDKTYQLKDVTLRGILSAEMCETSWVVAYNLTGEWAQLEADTFCLAIATAALRTLGITDDIED